MSERALITFGHSTADRDQLTALLRGAHVEAVVDVRTAPGSRHNPDVNRSELRSWLPERGFTYRWDKQLGGFRQVPSDSPDVVWRNDAFRGYAGYTRDPRFLEAMDHLLAGAAETTTAIMCSEAVWWRCHHRIIADFAVLARRVPVRHLMHDGRLQPHSPMPGARLRDDGLLVYDDTESAETGNAGG